MSLSCLGHGWARVAGQASATLLSIGELWLASGPAEEVGCCCRYKAWRAWCPHQECHRKPTLGQELAERVRVPLRAQGMEHAIYMSGRPEQGGPWVQAGAAHLLRDCHLGAELGQSTP